MGCPGYASYNINGDGTVEVNGQVPAFLVGSIQANSVKKAWKKYGGALQYAAKKYGIPKEWLLGLLMQESLGGTITCSPCTSGCCSLHLSRQCCAYGVMQFIPATAYANGTSPERLLQDPAHAIERAGHFLKKRLLEVGGDIVKAATLYNAGKLECGAETTFGYVSNHDYPYQLVKWSNTAKSLGLQRESLIVPTLAAAGIVTAGLIWWKPKF
jgi:soluble lytic murein transglycosylase-like protein